MGGAGRDDEGLRRRRIRFPAWLLQPPVKLYVHPAGREGEANAAVQPQVGSEKRSRAAAHRDRLLQSRRDCRPGGVQAWRIA